MHSTHLRAASEPPALGRRGQNRLHRAAGSTSPTGGAKRIGRGFTLIELIVVMAIVALLVGIAAPRYFQSVERAKVNALHSSLAVMRDALDKYAADKGRYPDTLEQLVQDRYLRQVPEDPLTGSTQTWVTTAPPADADLQGAVGDVHSGATGQAADGTSYADW